MKLLFALVAATLLVAGCAKPGGASVPEQDAEGRYVIHLTSANKFTPADAKVPLNATVLWDNAAGVHDVTAHDGSWKSPRAMSPGTNYQHTFAAAGEYDYHCTLHSGMVGTIHVGDDA
ncbi:MAG: plastocyanin/azurin family copper-binding protein [Candidatus Thermoplasmatota archaeon]